MSGLVQSYADPHLWGFPEELAPGAGPHEQIEGYTKAMHDAFAADLAAKYDFAAIAKAKPAKLVVEVEEDDAAATLSAALRAHYSLTGSNLYVLCMDLIEDGVSTVEHFECLTEAWIRGLAFSKSDTEKVAVSTRCKLHDNLIPRVPLRDCVWFQETKKAKAAEVVDLDGAGRSASGGGGELTVMQEKMLEEAYDRANGGQRFQMLWHTVRNKTNAPTNAQAKAWLAQAPDNPPKEDPKPEPAGKMVMRNGKYVVVKPGDKVSKHKPAPAPLAKEPEPEPEPAVEPEPEEVDPDDDPTLSDKEKKAIRRAKEKADRERLKAERAAAEALLAAEAGGTDDALFGGVEEAPPAPAPVPKAAKEAAPAPAPAPAPAAAPAAAKLKAEEAVPAPAPAAAAPAAVPEGIPPVAPGNVGIVGNKKVGGKSFYEIRWTDGSGAVHEVSRRYSEFDDLRKKLIKMVRQQV